MKKRSTRNDFAGVAGAFAFVATAAAEAAHWSNRDLTGFSNLDLTALIAGLFVLPVLAGIGCFLIVTAGRGAFRYWHVRKGWAHRLARVYGRRSSRVLHEIEDEIAYDAANRIALTAGVMTVVLSILLSYYLLVH